MEERKVKEKNMLLLTHAPETTTAHLRHHFLQVTSLVIFFLRFVFVPPIREVDFDPIHLRVGEGEGGAEGNVERESSNTVEDQERESSNTVHRYVVLDVVSKT